ncbi:MAG: FixH family protein [Pseudomonadota bacterium]
MIRELKGWHVGAIFGSGFAVIIAVNLTLAYSAVSTFPGLEVKNSYVASQSFDADRSAQNALGWTVEAEERDGMVRLQIVDDAGAPQRAASLTAVLGRATHVKDDVVPDFVFDGVAYTAPVQLASGNWNLRIKATAANGTEFRQRLAFYVAR